VVATAVTCAAIFVVTWPLWTNGTPFYDDYRYAFYSRAHGFWAPTGRLFDYFGTYRPGVSVAMSVIGAFHDHLWVVRVFGVVCHCVAVFAAIVTWRRLGGTVAGAAALAVVFGVYPYSLEAIAWPTASAGYPFAVALLLVATALLLQKPDAAVRAGLYAAAGTAAVLFNEQILPVIVVVFAACAIRFPSLRRPLVLGAAPVLALFAVLTWMTIPSNPRFTGPYAATPVNILKNLHFLSDLNRLSPFGDLFWNSSGVRGRSLALGLVVGVLVALAWLLATMLAPQHGASARRWRVRFSLGAAVGGVTVVAGTIAPILMSGFPWLTPRVAYMPMLGVAIAVGALAELAFDAGQLARIALAAAGSFLVLWSFAVLATEAAAYDTQLRYTTHQLTELMAVVDPRWTIRPNIRLMIAGFPPTITERPFVGEHILGLVPEAFLYSALDVLHVPEERLRGHWDFHSGYGGLCLSARRRLEVDRDYRASRPDIWGVKGVSTVFAVWVQDRWVVQAPNHPLPNLLPLREVIPACAPS
jgi:hypothetical protein